MAEFWTLTPRLVVVCLDADVKRRNDEIELQSNLASWQVWRLAWLMRVKTLPTKPDDLLKTKGSGNSGGKGTGPDWKAQKAVFEMYNAAFGGFDNRKKAKPEKG